MAGWRAVENPVFLSSMVKEQVACENETGACFRFPFLFFFFCRVVAPLMHLPELGSDSRRMGGAVAAEEAAAVAEEAAAAVTNARVE